MGNISETTVREFLKEKQVESSYVGYKYLLRAIMLVLSHDELLEQRKIETVYILVAHDFLQPPSRVERSIRATLRQSHCKLTSGRFIFHAADTLLATHRQVTSDDNI